VSFYFFWPGRITHQGAWKSLTDCFVSFLGYGSLIGFKVGPEDAAAIAEVLKKNNTLEALL